MQSKLFAFVLLATPALAAPAVQPPTLRLPDNVRPIRYALDLTVTPGQDPFHGAVDIELEAKAPTQIVWLSTVALQIKSASYRAEGGQTMHPQVVPGGEEFTGFSFEHPVSGRGALHLEYEGKISRNSSAGLFQLKEDDQWYVYSQFEPTDARRAFPCFDEPGFKVPWSATLHVPKEQLALFNTPQVSETQEAGGMKAVKFSESKPLPSYLVALAVGPFDVVDAGKLGKTPLRVIVPRGKGDGAKYAAEAIPQLLKLLEEYFQTPFPYEKLDSVVMPISNFAMENAGLITYGQTLLLAKPSEDSIVRQRQMAIVVAHEMAHQWFGDYVTTGWWNDIWLNEAFASWMERKVTAQWKPEWHLDVTAVTARLGAMRQDSLMSARKIRQPIESNDDIANAFDDITYEKGAAVINMFETWLGKEKFRKGIQLYIKQHAWGNATASEFEAAIGEAAGRNIAPAFNSFLDQAGIPEISMSLDCSSKPKLKMEQTRLLPIGSKGSAKENWRVPVCVAYEADGATHHQCEMLADPRTEMVLSQAKTCPSWILPNDGESGYYQVNYKGDLLNKTLANKGSHLTVAERVGVLGNVQALVNTGDISPRTALALVPEFANDADREVVAAAAGIAGILKAQYVPDELRSKAARFIREVFGKRAAALGWSSKPNENEDTRLLRQTVVPLVAISGEDRDLIAQAKKLADAWLLDHKAVSPDMIAAVLRTAAEFGNRDFFDRLLKALSTEHNQRLRQRLLVAVGSFRDPEIAKASLQLVVSKDFDARESFSALLFGPLAYPETRALPFEYVRQNLDKVLAKLPREVGEDFAANLPFVGNGFCDAGHRAEIQTFFQDRVKDYVGGPRNLTQTLEGIDLCIAKRDKLGADVVAFLSTY